MTMPDETGTHELPDGTRGTVEQAAPECRYSATGKHEPCGCHPSPGMEHCRFCSASVKRRATTVPWTEAQEHTMTVALDEAEKKVAALESEVARLTAALAKARKEGATAMRETLLDLTAILRLRGISGDTKCARAAERGDAAIAALPTGGGK